MFSPKEDSQTYLTLKALTNVSPGLLASHRWCEAETPAPVAISIRRISLWPPKGFASRVSLTVRILELSRPFHGLRLLLRA